MQKNAFDITVFLIVVTALISCLGAFIAFMFVSYKRRQNNFQQYLEEIKHNHEKTLLSTQLEIQEETFQYISREIHDNINLTLTLAKLNLNTINKNEPRELYLKVDNTVELLTKSISELSDLSKALNSNVITQQGLTKAIESEINRVRQAGNIEIVYSLTGNPIYLSSQNELVIFRIVQEAFNNILKHAAASTVKVNFHYSDYDLVMNVCDNGKGFSVRSNLDGGKAGLLNMESRVKMLGGEMEIKSDLGSGTTLIFIIPYEVNGK